MNKEQFFEFFIEKAKEQYIKVLGTEKWNSLSDKEKHDAIMMIAKGLLIM